MRSSQLFTMCGTLNQELERITTRMCYLPAVQPSLHVCAHSRAISNGDMIIPPRASPRNLSCGNSRHRAATTQYHHSPDPLLHTPWLTSSIFIITWFTLNCISVGLVLQRVLLHREYEFVMFLVFREYNCLYSSVYRHCFDIERGCRIL